MIEYSRQAAGSFNPFTVVAWLHDGVWAKCEPESAERHIARVEDLIRASSIKYLGFEMEVDVDKPHGW